MKLYSLVHMEVIGSKRQYPLSGCSYVKNSPYLYAFDSAASACLESSLYKTLKGIPPTFAIVAYTCPADSLYRPELNSWDGYGDYELQNSYFGKWAESFLKNNTALIAEFPSKNWSWALVKNYIINANHELFGEVQICEVFKTSKALLL